MMDLRRKLATRLLDTVRIAEAMCCRTRHMT